ncbi:MAG: hypothetical protein SH857_14740 [Chitinophagales bacterium]|nr:hypothetical protein [Chitinophagales bacterium]
MLNSTLADKGIFRIKDWWQSKAALLMGMVYLFTAWFDIGFDQFLLLALLSVATISGFASFGYLLNDFFDRESDALAGKKNFLAGKSQWSILLLFLLALIILLLPWRWLPFTVFSAALIGAQILLFIIYSAPPLRLKEKGISGIVIDALYAHALPVILAAYTYSLAAGKSLPALPIILLFAWQSFSGIRNILLHQADDLQSDKKSGAKNFVAGIFPSPFYRYIRNSLLLEVAFSLTFFSVLLFSDRLFTICFVTILIFALLIFIRFREKELPVFLASKWKFFPNNVYEKWLPLSLLVAFCFIDKRFAVILLVHLVLFNANAILQFFRFVYDVADVAYANIVKVAFHQVFVVFPDAVYQLLKRFYYFAKTWLKLITSSLINYPIYYVFLLFGVDLRKKNSSALDYLKRNKKAKLN